jgi:hypothetical protein
VTKIRRRKLRRIVSSEPKPQRAKATVTEVDASHASPRSQLEIIAKVIAEAARFESKN